MAITSENFSIKIKENFSDIFLLEEYTGWSNPILVKDNLGILYKPTCKALFAGNRPTIRTAIDKTICFKTKLKQVNPDLTLIDKYISARSKVLVMDSFGILYKATPTMLLQGHAPLKKSMVNKTEEYIKKFHKIHNFKYQYNINTIKNLDKDLISIKCPNHGVFNQLAHSHIKGSGCPKCSQERSLWGYSDWNNAGLNSNYFESFKLYIIRCYDDNESFYKIGKTFLNLKSRFYSGNTNKLPYYYDIINTYEGDSFDISNLEVLLHRLYKNYSYVPLKDFYGKTECFKF